MLKLLKSLLTAAFISTLTAGVGDEAPDFTLNQQGGGSFTLSDHRGKVVYIFWFGYN